MRQYNYLHLILGLISFQWFMFPFQIKHLLNALACNLILNVRRGGYIQRSFIVSCLVRITSHYPFTVYFCLQGLRDSRGVCGAGRCVLYLPRSTPRSYSLPLLRQGRFRTSPCQRSGSHGSAASLVLQGLPAHSPHAAYVSCPDPAEKEERQHAENQQIESEILKIVQIIFYDIYMPLLMLYIIRRLLNRKGFFNIYNKVIYFTHLIL